MGSDDGIIKILRDASDSDTSLYRSSDTSSSPSSGGASGARPPSAYYSSSSSSGQTPTNQFVMTTSNDSVDVRSRNIYAGGIGEELCGVSVASSFVALPDIADTTQGSGLVTSWLQRTGRYMYTHMCTYICVTGFISPLSNFFLSMYV